MPALRRPLRRISVAQLAGRHGRRGVLRDSRPCTRGHHGHARQRAETPPAPLADRAYMARSSWSAFRREATGHSRCELWRRASASTGCKMPFIIESIPCGRSATTLDVNPFAQGWHILPLLYRRHFLNGFSRQHLLRASGAAGFSKHIPCWIGYQLATTDRLQSIGHAPDGSKPII